MARPPRFVADDHVHLISQMAITGLRLFPEAADRERFTALVRESAKAEDVAVHAYALLPESVLIVATPATSLALARFMQRLGRHYVPWFNRKYGRTGTLWQGRFRASVVIGQELFFTACRYVEEAPVRAGLASAPAAYPWSSYEQHAGLQLQSWLGIHPFYWQLGNTPFEREAAYVRLFDQSLTPDVLTSVTDRLTSGWALASREALDELEKIAGRRLSPGKRGRPPSSGAKAALKDAPLRIDSVPK